MPVADNRQNPRPFATDRRWLFGLASLLAVVTVGVMATAIIGSALQAGVRAYVGGEGLWSKAEKNAVIQLQRFVATHDEADWDGYRAELDVILGDRRARLELEKPNPDAAVVADGFVDGGNSIDDVPSMTLIFRTFRHMTYIDRAITIWTAADAEIDRLDRLASDIRSATERQDPVALERLTAELDAANGRLTLLENDFSGTLGEGARWVRSVLLVVMAVILGLLVAITAILGRFMLRRLRAADRRSAEILRASESRLRLVLDHLPAIVWTTDRDLLVTSITGDGLARLGVDGSTFIGRVFGSLFGSDLGTGGGDREAAELAHRDALRGHAASYRTTVADRTFQLHVEPLLVDGRIIGTIGLGQDLTDRLELEARLERSTRLESIGRLAGGIAHDFNNLLTAITGYADLLVASLPEGDERHDAEQIRRAGQRAADLTSQLLAFGRRQVLKPELVQPNDVIDEMKHMLARLVGGTVALDLDLDPDLPRIMADPGQLEQVIVNLAVNARDAMPEGGRLTIATSRTTMTPATGPHDPVRPGGPADAVSIRVQDNGSGMDETTLARIFEPFFTTKGRGKGNGLGLSTVYGIVDQSGGSIQVESTVSVGTTFTIVLAATLVDPAPVTAPDIRPGPARPADAHPTPIGLSPGSRALSAPRVGASDALADPLDRRPTILVAEDETAVRDLVVHILVNAGCTVIAAIDGRDALIQSDRHPRIDALVSDVMMPHLNGPQLAERLHIRMPDLPVLFMSGFTGDVLGERGMVDPDVELLTKPFLPAELLTRVRAILAERPILDESPEVVEVA